ncbi:MAG: T9SS type A sorting domain-containing protein [Chitinophagales bacterium]|nr:T9SS type A sorting domain-containing protein [Chitinophagales bacterium]
MKIQTLILTLIQFIAAPIVAQEFYTTIIAESNNELDSIIIGYDISASIGIDSQFGEIDISNTSFNPVFEIRVGQIDLNELNCDMNTMFSSPDLVSYMSEIDIVPRDCEGWDEAVTINGLAPISTLYIRNKDLPVKLNWDSSIFANECLESSLITDWHPGGWFDASCDGVSIPPLNLMNQDSVIIINPSGISLVDLNGDTLSMFHILLGGINQLNKVEEWTLEEQVKIYPNPTKRYVTIETKYNELRTVKIYNSNGKLLEETMSNLIIDMEGYPSGVYYLRINLGGNYLTKKIKKYSH